MDKIPLLGAPVEEHVEDEGVLGNRRTFRPAVPTDPNLPATIGHNQPPARMAPPVYEPLSHKILSDPQSLGGMKQGTPQQWLNKLKGAGIKNEEAEYGLGLVRAQNNKVSREEMLGHIRSSVPKIADKALGASQKEQVLIAGDEDAEDAEPPDMEARWGNWEQDEPDWSYIENRAKESAEQDLDEKYEDPEFVEKHIPEALESFGKDWLHEKIPANRERLRAFAQEAVEHGWE